jgi:glutamate racemase
LPKHIKILDSGEAVAKHCRNTLETLNLLRKDKSKPMLQFYTNAEITTLEWLLKDFSADISVVKKDF